MDNVSRIADILRGNPYPGRGILLGHTPAGNPVAAYFIMGRSANSRNRVFEKVGDDVVIRPYDQARVEDAALIHYTPLRQCGDALVVTNGDQTETICAALGRRERFETALETREYEPDAPNYTPRISGLLYPGRRDEPYRLSILRRGPGGGCDRFYFAYAPAAGIGRLIHTYLGEGNPLPSFTGEPRAVELPEDLEDLCRALWYNLEEGNRISLYMRRYRPEGGYEERLVNKY